MDNFPKGFAHYPLYFDTAAQAELIRAVRDGVKQAPFYVPRMPRTGTPMSVALSNFGTLGWVTDKEKAIVMSLPTRSPARPGPICRNCCTICGVM